MEPIPLPSLPVGEWLKDLLILATVIYGGGRALAWQLRSRGLMWTWAFFGVPVALLVWGRSLMLGLALGFGCLRAVIVGARMHGTDLQAGGELAAAARNRAPVLETITRRIQEKRRGPREWMSRRGLEVGVDARRRPVHIPVGRSSGCHTLAVGATGSGKTVTLTWIVCGQIEAGYGAIIVDPKGDRLLHGFSRHAAESAGRPFLEWTPEGPLAYNPYAQGGADELVGKALAGETFTEPHYLRLSERYIAHAMRVMRAGGITVTPVSLMEHMDPLQLEASARRLSEVDGRETLAYLDKLEPRQRRDLAGIRDRLSIVAESEARQWLEPGGGLPELDLRAAIAERAVVYFRLDADRRMLLSQMIAASIISDLVTISADLQGRPVPTAVLIDEFASIAAHHTGKLFSKARSAGLSLILGTQELSDLNAAGPALLGEVTGNLSGLIAHRQNVPASAEMIADIAGTHETWIATRQTGEGLLGPGPTGRGSITRGHEYEIHPSHIKRLPTGVAAVITPGHPQAPTIARIHHPREATQ